MSLPVVGVDLRQFFTQPYATGVQRVLLCLLENWPEIESEVRVLCRHESRLYFISSTAAARCIRVCFEFSGEYSGSNDSLRLLVAEQLEQESRFETTWPEALLMVDRWLIAEPTADVGLLREWTEASRVMPTTMIFYDALPQTNPEFFGPIGVTGASAYSRMAASMRRVLSISDHAAEIIVERLGNKNPGAALVALPGADHVAINKSSAPRKTSFLVLSSVEKRKRLGVIIEAFHAASATVGSLELHIVGRSSSDSALVQDAVDKDRSSRIVWSRAANDEALTEFAAKSTALFSIGEEGYGLPTLEMLRRGCPVVFAGTQPAAELAVGAGTMRLADYSVESVTAAMLHLTDYAQASKFRSSIDVDRLPTWSSFAQTVARATVAI